MSELAKIVLTAGVGLLTGALLAVLGTRQRLEVEYDIELRKRRIEAYQALLAVCSSRRQAARRTSTCRRGWEA